MSRAKRPTRNGVPSGVALPLLVAASRLRKFTVSEIAEHAGVRPEAARSFLRRSDDVERVEFRSRQGRGRPEWQWRLRLDRELSVAARLADVASVVSQSQMHERMSSEPTTLQLLESTLLALETNSVTNFDERRQEIELAKLYLASAESEIRDREALSFTVRPEEREVIVRARRRCALLRPGRATPVLSPDAFAVPNGEELQATFKHFLEDWTAQIKVTEFELQPALSIVTAHGIENLLEDALRAGVDQPNTAGSVFKPSIALARYRRAWNPEMQRNFVQVLTDKLSLREIVEDPFALGALAVTAAAFDAVEAAEPLFRALLSPYLAMRLSGQLRDICILSLARLARPAPRSRNSEIASSACHYLLMRIDAADQNLPILAIGALTAPYSNAPSIIHSIGHTLFERGGMRRAWSDRITEGAMMRNLALSLHSGNFAVLQDSIESLMERESYGPGLVASLRSPEHMGLELTDTNDDNGFIVRAGLRVAECLGLQDRRPVALNVSDKAASRLSEMISQSNWMPQLAKTVGAEYVAPNKILRFPPSLSRRGDAADNST